MKSTFRKYVMFLLLLSPIIWGACTDDGDDNNGNNGDVNNTNFNAEEPFSYTIGVENRTLLRLVAINGDVTVTGTPGANSFIITGIRRVESESTADAEEHLAELDVATHSTSNEVFAETIQPEETHGRNYIVHYTITLPTNLEVDVTNVNGQVAINSIDNTVSVININGDTDLYEISGSAAVQLTNGTIDSRINLPPDGIIGMSVVNGAIELDIPQNTSAAFSASVTNGSINVSNLVLQNEENTATSLSGILGAGQGAISLTTTNGNIVVTGF